MYVLLAYLLFKIICNQKFFKIILGRKKGIFPSNLIKSKLVLGSGI